MTYKVKCCVLNKELPGLEALPYPDEIGQRIYENVSQEGWVLWLQRLAAIINENGLNTADPSNLQLIEQHMVGFFFNEGDFKGEAPEGFRPATETVQKKD